MSSPADQHRALAPKTVTCVVITVSDTRTLQTDETGKILHDRLSRAGHCATRRRSVPDDAPQIRAAIEQEFARPEVQAVILNGGTGIAARDVTIEVVESFLEKKLDGFGEIFRMLSYQQIGSAAVLSRAVAGSARGKILVALPGSPIAAKLALEKILLPELAHMVQQASR